MELWERIMKLAEGMSVFWRRMSNLEVRNFSQPQRKLENPYLC